ncbi:oxidoreductase [Aspergillus heteromorphus CBS 117.55]|uniref:Oxidoreductase n=1 Tax=Aspergillus heteromorphus CBS 117.55 TaxID=1448321 RepID=A0A317W8P6_9EURO|nr:oxidoreductase [Aspergillus heteromorphus CBS 117.55]PWY82101.1 oxidoreductase [Aspergillus heteromorphus CBS 117.55]
MASHPSRADYIIIGGGTAGLVVANRLAENPNIEVLVLEAGPDRTSEGRVQDPAAWPTLTGSDVDWQFQTVPQPGLNNRHQDQPAGRVLGGTSSISGLAFVPPSPAGIDAWEALGNPGWNWSNLSLALERSFHTSLPADSALPAHPANGPVAVTYPALSTPGNHPLIDAWNNTLAAQGYPFRDTFLPTPTTTGTRPYTAAITPGGLRSASTHYTTPRPNLHILTNTPVERILFDPSTSPMTATGVLLHNNPDPITATKEVILAAGAFQTPKLLELSGIGSASLLTTHNIPCLIDHPSVGENLQNQLLAILPIPVKASPDTAGLTPGIQALAFVRSGSEADLLSQHGHGIPPPLHTLLSTDTEPTACTFLTTLSPSIALLGLIPSYPLSRGSVHISSPHPDEKPTIDPNFFSHPLDLPLMASHFRNLQSLPSTSPLNEFLIPPPNLPAEALDLAILQEVLKASALATHHACGTAVMAPKEEGGVVDSQLRVYGTANLRVVDASIFPVGAVAYPIATVYGVAERAAELIAGEGERGPVGL